MKFAKNISKLRQNVIIIVILTGQKHQRTPDNPDDFLQHIMDSSQYITKIAHNIRNYSHDIMTMRHHINMPRHNIMLKTYNIKTLTGCSEN